MPVPGFLNSPARWMASMFMSEEEKEEFGVLSEAVKAKMMAEEYSPPKNAATNGRDLLAWQLQFGSQPGGTAALASVPEPASVLLLTLGLLPLMLRRK